MTASHPRRPAASDSLRLPLLAACIALLAACGGEPAPVTATPAAPATQDAAVAPAPAAPPAASVPFDREFSVEDPALQTLAGERVAGVGLRTTGRAGWLAFGPYVPVPRGRYVVELRGSVDAGHAGDLHVDIADGKGTNVIKEVEVSPGNLGDPAKAGVLFTLPFELAVDSADLEVRVHATDASRVSVTGYRIRATP